MSINNIRRDKLKELETNTRKEQASIKRTNVPKANVSRETILNGTNFRLMYRLFRRDKLSVVESLYNAAYLACHNKYESSVSKVKNKYQKIHFHPVAWSTDKRKVYKNNVWSVCMKALDGAEKIIRKATGVKKFAKNFFRKIAYIPKSMDNSIRAIKAFLRITGRLVLPVLAVSFCVFSVVVISDTMKKQPVLGVYIDGEYVGNTMSLSDVLKSKHICESNLSVRYGTPIILECDIDFQPLSAVVAPGSVIASGDTSIFDKYLSEFVTKGYGLYIDNKLAAVTSAQKWFDESIEEYISNQKANYKAKYSVSDEEVDKFVYNNNIKIIADNYPESYFLTHSEVRRLFGLAELTPDDYTLVDGGFHYSKIENENVGSTSGEIASGVKLDYSHLPHKLEYTAEDNISGGLTGSIPANTIVMDIAVVKDESKREVIPYTTEYIFDETMLEGMRRLVSDGKDGEKIIYYKSTYKNGKLEKQEVSGEEIVRQPKNKVIRTGKRPLTDEEKSYIPTGTYIYPYQGHISSYYGWRILRGQYNFHQGLDITGPWGDDVVASDAGEVIEVGYSSGYGRYCIIQHDEDTQTRYAHCDRITVEVGDLVAQGDKIGTLGATGNATGVHVHFEIIESGITVNPSDYLSD